MQAVKSDAPPGCVVMSTGDITRYAASMQSYTSLHVPSGSMTSWHIGVLVARNLNDGIENMLARPELQWAWIMGDDHTYPPDTLLRLLAHDVDAVIPFVLNRYPPFAPTVVTATQQRMKHLSEMPASGLYQLRRDETCGDAGLLVRRHVLEKIGEPWYRERRSGAFAADDQEFTRTIQDAGFPIYCDMGTRITHISPFAVYPIWKDGRWQVRVATPGGDAVCDIVPAPGTEEQDGSMAEGA